MAHELSAGNPLLARQYFDATIGKAIPAFDKMEDDTRGRLRPTLAVMEGCRLFSFAFVGSDTVVAIRGAMVKLASLPNVNDMLPDLEQELEDFHRIASVSFQQNGKPTIRELWEFWQQNATILPEWYKCALEVALVMTSSACVERIFSCMITCSQIIKRGHWKIDARRA